MGGVEEGRKRTHCFISLLLSIPISECGVRGGEADVVFGLLFVAERRVVMFRLRMEGDTVSYKCGSSGRKQF